jgi:hypothetical protein
VTAQGAKLREVQVMRMISTDTMANELERDARGRGRWRTRTRVEDRREPPPIYSTEPEVTWTPQPYEPAPCTCEDGFCNCDHEHE